MSVTDRYTGWREAVTDSAVHYQMLGKAALCGLWPLGEKRDPKRTDLVCQTCVRVSVDRGIMVHG